MDEAKIESLYTLLEQIDDTDTAAALKEAIFTLEHPPKPEGIPADRVKLALCRIRDILKETDPDKIESMVAKKNQWNLEGQDTDAKRNLLAYDATLQALKDFTGDI